MEGQTLPPEEILIVEDGLLPKALKQVIDEFKKRKPNLYTIISLNKNNGLGKALAIGLQSCRNEIVVRMDSDDYSTLTRVEQELKMMQETSLDLIGTQVAEFIDSPDKPINHSNLPTKHDDIINFSKRRNPFRHPSVAFKKSKALAAGNYNGNFPYFEDWDLFNRMLRNGAQVANLNHTLVYMRVSPDFYERRGGWNYFHYMWTFKRQQLQNHYFNFWDFCCSTLPHAVICLIPNKLRSSLYNAVLRKN